MGGKKVISFSLYGQDPRYTVGMVRNIELAMKFYPGWEVRIYHPYQEACWTLLCGALPNYKLDDVETRTGPESIPPMFWRFLVADDPEVERFICRDADSRLNAREAAAVAEWIIEDTVLHTMRDHPAHARPINGGMWGGVWRRDSWSAPKMMDLIEQWLKENPEGADQYMRDQDFLGAMVWPWARTSCTQHDSVSRQAYPGSKPFPIKRDHPRFVGEVFLIGEDGKDVPRDGDWQQVSKDKE